MNSKKANSVIVTARVSIDDRRPMASSARFCLHDAIRAYDSGDYATAFSRAMRSLQYSVGILHPSYRAFVR